MTTTTGNIGKLTMPSMSPSSWSTIFSLQLVLAVPIKQEVVEDFLDLHSMHRNWSQTSQQLTYYYTI